MYSFLSYLLNLETKICRPDPTFFPDPDQRNELYLKNRGQFRSNINFLIIYGLANIFFNFQASSHLFWLGFMSLHLSSLILFCRTRIWICHWIYTPSVTFGQLVFIILLKDSFIYALIISFITPVCVLAVTKSLVHVSSNFIGQIILLHLKYKYILEEVILETDPKEFSQKFITAASSTLIVITVCFTVMFKTLQDHEKQLKASKLNAEAAYLQLDLFLKTFSHELRNPLNSLLGNLQLALQEALPPKVYEMVETAKVCGDLLLQLINNILDTGKAQTGKLDISPNPTRMGEYITGIWRISRDLMRRKKLNGCLRIDKRLPANLNIDAYRMNQVLLNLLSNAIKFTDKGQVFLTFSWIPNALLCEKCFVPYPFDDDGLFEKNQNFRTMSRSAEEADALIYLDSKLDILKSIQLQRSLQSRKGILKITIRDTGAGIKEEDMKLLFNKFSQVGSDMSKKKVGTGLGLYITKQICEAMGGEVRVYSKERVGTAFIVCVPTVAVDDFEQVSNISQAINELKYMKLQMLLVDDNIFNLDLLSNYANKIDANVVGSARNGLEGYNKYLEIRGANKRMDIVFLDIDMPVMNGKTMCKMIREYEASRSVAPVKIVFVTGNYDESQIKELMDKTGKYRGDGFIKKPVSLDVFINTLEKVSR